MYKAVVTAALAAPSRCVARAVSPLFKFGFNPSLIDGILNVLPYELAS